MSYFATSHIKKDQNSTSKTKEHCEPAFFVSIPRNNPTNFVGVCKSWTCASWLAVSQTLPELRRVSPNHGSISIRIADASLLRSLRAFWPAMETNLKDETHQARICMYLSATRSCDHDSSQYAQVRIVFKILNFDHVTLTHWSLMDVWWVA